MYYSTATTQVAQLPFTCSTSSLTPSRLGPVPSSSTHVPPSSQHLVSQRVPTWKAQDRTGSAPLRHPARGSAGPNNRHGLSSVPFADPYYPGPLPLWVQASYPASLS